MLKNSYWKLGSIACVSAVLAACSSDVASPKHSAAAQNSKSSPDTIWVQSPQKHNNSGISMRYRIDGSLAVGQAVTVQLEFSGVRASDAHVSVSPAKTLAVGVSGGLQKSGDNYLSPLKTNEVTARSFTVTPTSEGAHFISVQLTQNGQTSTAGIMLRVGQKGQAHETLGDRVSTENGEKLIVMPAK